MVGYEQIRSGIVTYIGKDLAPLLPKAYGIGLAAFAPAVVDAKLKQIFQSNILSGTTLVDGNMIDIDEAMRMLKPAAEGKWPIEMYGFKFTESDLDKLYKYIKEA